MSTTIARHGFLALVVSIVSGGSLMSRAASAADPISGKVLFFAAASTIEAADEILAGFRRLHPMVVVRVSYGASSTLAQQIAAGAEADVFLSAGPEVVDMLTAKNLVDKKQDLLSNQLAIVTPVDSRLVVDKPADLVEPRIRHVALADPRSVPAGIYARQALERLGLWARLEAKVTGAADVRQALHFVESGAAEAGIVYVTDAAANKKVRIAARIEPDAANPIRYPLVLVKRSTITPAARGLFDYLSSPAAAAVFRAHGFIVLDRSAAEAD